LDGNVVEEAILVDAQSQNPTTDQLLRALNHPLRRRILRLMDNETSSPAALAAELGEPLPSVSYHVRVLDKCDVLQLVRAQPVRGSVEHVYRSLVEPKWARTALRDSATEDQGGA
jgi:DNA-binding transcriptional ArsR family regulator